MARSIWQRNSLAFFIGMGMEAGLGVLLAPKSGKETRGEIVDGVKDTVDGIVMQENQMGRRARKTFEDAKDQLKAAVEAGGQAYRESKTTSP